jgi:acetylornithine deacetylase/succinyl-diaminopimelate desuccinylase-like protein
LAQLSEVSSQAVADESVQYLQDLLRIDTTNPPGNETAAIEYVAGVLRSADYEPTILESAPGRGNIVARYPGTGEMEPLLIYSHVDVVTAEPEHWTHAPFSGDIDDGCVWGRGALDMKSMVAQELMVMLLLKRSHIRLKRDVIFAATADEEAGGKAGMGYLVDHRRDLVRAEYGLSEGAGMTTYLGGRPFYDIRTAEKGTCRFHLRAHGAPGHGSVPRPDTAVQRVADAVTKLAATSLPFRATPTLVALFAAIGEGLKLPAAERVPSEANLKNIMQRLPASLGQYLNAITRDTAVPTGLRAGKKINVIPSVAEAWVDGRYLPGQTFEGFLDEIRQVIGEGYEIEPVDRSEPLEDPPGGLLYETIVRVMRGAAPEAPVAPFMLAGATDAKHVSRLGTKCLGFSPVRVSEDFPAEQLVHGHDERIPIDGFVWGLRVLHEIVTEFCSG